MSLNLIIGIIVIALLLVALKLGSKLIQFILGIVLVVWAFQYFNVLYYIQYLIDWLKNIIA